MSLLGYDAMLLGKYFVTPLGLWCVQSTGNYSYNNTASYPKILDSSKRLL